VFRVLDFGPDGSLEVYDGPERAVPPPAGVVRWVDLTSSAPDVLELLRQRFLFHPLAIEDCAHLDQRPKLEEFQDHLFLVTQGLAHLGPRVKKLEVYELHAFLGERVLVTVHEGKMPTLDKVWERTRMRPSPIERGVDFVYYLLADGLVDLGFPILDCLNDELVEIEDRVLLQPKQRDLNRILELRRHLVLMRKVLAPQRDTMAMLARRGDAHISERTSLYFRDVYDHLARLTESVEANRDLLGNVIEAYMSSVSMRTNEIMKYLTLLSAVFLPLAFVVGFFGQNFENLPGLSNWVSSDALMWVMIAICVGTPVGMVTWFKRQGWI
jgi:magnesium transporter